MATRPRLATTNERVAILEEKETKTEERLGSIEKKLDDVYTLLIQAKGVIWLGTKIAGAITLACVVIGAVVAVLKYLHG
jgi:tetrahydromethanopterin S-methyltransferase subunit G